MISTIFSNGNVCIKLLCLLVASNAEWSFSQVGADKLNQIRTEPNRVVQFGSKEKINGFDSLNQELFESGSVSSRMVLVLELRTKTRTKLNF